MRFVYTLFLTFVFTSAFSQTRQNVYFLKTSGLHVSTRDSADFIRIIREPDSGSVFYELKEYYPNGTVKLMSHTSGISVIKYEGQCLKFYKNGGKKEVLNYTKGVLSGRQYYYYPNARFKEERDYPTKPADKKTLTDGLYTIVNAADSAGKMMVTDGNGYYKNEYEAASSKSIVKWISEGEIKNGLRNGFWKSSVSKDSIQLAENYDNGKFIEGKATYANGETSTYTEPDKLPEFKGGQKEFAWFLGNNLRYPEKARNMGVQGTVLLTFVVEKDGSLSNIKVLGKAPSKEIGDEAIRILNKSPKWLPGRQFGRVVRVAYTVPIVFSL